MEISLYDRRKRLADLSNGVLMNLALTGENRVYAQLALLATGAK